MLKSGRRFGGLWFSACLAVVLVCPGVVAADERPPAASPKLEAVLLDGAPFSLTRQRGVVTLLVLWSPESLASRKSMGELQRFHAASGGRVHTVAVSTLPDTGYVRHYAADHGFEFPVAILGQHNLGILDEQRLPLIYIIDGDGVVRAIHAGLFRLRDLEQGVAAVLP